MVKLRARNEGALSCVQRGLNGENSARPLKLAFNDRLVAGRRSGSCVILLTELLARGGLKMDEI